MGIIRANGYYSHDDRRDALRVHEAGSIVRKREFRRSGATQRRQPPA
jgi:hypothetical protein